MARYSVYITEIWHRIKDAEVEADSADEAVDKVQEMLDADTAQEPHYNDTDVVVNEIKETQE